MPLTSDSDVQGIIQCEEPPRRCYRCLRSMSGWAYILDDDPAPSCEDCLNALIQPVPSTYFFPGGQVST